LHRAWVTIWLVSIACGTAAGGEKKLIILGFDGLDARLTRKWMDEGKLPNFARLREEGCFAELGTSNPAQSPVAWSCFGTGMNPGKTRIMGFLKRVNTEQGPIPEIALGHRKMMPVFDPPVLRFIIPIVGGVIVGVLCLPILTYILRVRRRMKGTLIIGFIIFLALLWACFRWLPAELPVPVGDKWGKDFWYLLGERDIPCTVILAPVSFPARHGRNVRLLCGLGTPDIRGTTGIWSFYSTLAVGERDTEMGGVVIPLKFERGYAKSRIIGPPDPFQTRRNLSAWVEFFLLPDKKLRIKTSGGEVILGVGQWSDWLRFDFKASPLISISGMGRFYVVSVEPSVQVYLTPVNFDPSDLPATVRLSNPSDFARSLARDLGRFDTLGWAASTNVLAEEMIDEEAFLSDLRAIMKRRRRIVEHELKRGGWRCFVGIFYSTDRVQHMFWRLIDEKHPRYDAELAKRYGNAILDFYRECDDITGFVMKNYVDEDTLLIIVSDHGFRPFRKMVNLNNFLADNGYLHTTRKRSDMMILDLFQPSLFFEGVDWSRTRAYALGLGKIYINLKGRERFGIVEPDDYEKLRDEIIRKLLSLRDPETGERVVLRAYKREEIRTGKFANEEADIVLGFNDGYRISWQTTLGGFGKKVVEPNMQKWSGDHCSIDPSLLAGVFLSNGKPRDYNIDLMDIAPTVLTYFEIDVPRIMDGRAIQWE